MDLHQLFEPPVTDDSTRRTAAGRDDNGIAVTTSIIKYN